MSGRPGRCQHCGGGVLYKPDGRTLFCRNVHCFAWLVEVPVPAPPDPSRAGTYECGCETKGDYPFCPVHGADPSEAESPADRLRRLAAAEEGHTIAIGDPTQAIPLEKLAGKPTTGLAEKALAAARSEVERLGDECYQRGLRLSDQESELETLRESFEKACASLADEVNKRETLQAIVEKLTKERDALAEKVGDWAQARVMGALLGSRKIPGGTSYAELEADCADVHKALQELGTKKEALEAEKTQLLLDKADLMLEVAKLKTKA